MKRLHAKTTRKTYIICNHERQLIAEVSGPAKPTIRLLWLRFLKQFDLEKCDYPSREPLFVKWLINNNGFTKVKHNLVKLEQY